MTYLSSRRGAAWAGTTLIAMIIVGVIAGIALHLTAVMLTMLIGALVLALVISVPTTRRERVAAPAKPRVITFTPEPLAQREIVLSSGEVRQALVVPVEQAEGYQLVLTIDGQLLLNERNEVVKLPLK